MPSFNKTMIEHACSRLLAGFLPDGRGPGVAISFDDAYVNEWYCLRDLLNKYAAKVTFFVSGFDLLPAESVEKLRILENDGHEIAFHGLRHLSAGKFVAENSLHKYLETEIFPGIDTMTRCGFSPATFSYPYGVRAPHIDAALLKYFKHVRGVVCTNSKKRLTDFKQIYYGHGEGLVFAAGIDNVYGNRVEEIHDAMKKAVDRKKTLLLYAHKISDEAGGYCTPVSRMEALLEYASKAGLTFCRIKDL
ncbi:MAG: polysaccharide deacetylase family protein [Nitrospiraceae bacterium]|nr:polysaccharide deacetylase family protein [Nitrospiraceae bacterium]